MPKYRCKNGFVQYPIKSQNCIDKTTIKRRFKRCINGTRKSKVKNLMGVFDCVPIASKHTLIPTVLPSLQRDIIGKGSYGCVYRPYIPCKEHSIKLPNGSAQNLVSKFMSTYDAKKEVKEFTIIHNKDPANKFHLGVPTICQPDYNDPKIVNELKMCQLNTNDPLLKNTVDSKNFSVLTFPYGGVSLSDFCKNELPTFPVNLVRGFWTQGVLNLMNGLVFFRTNNIIHYDLKPHNILFDQTNMSMKYIDFGIMINRTQFINDSTNNINKNACIHWSYPFSNGFVNAKILNRYASASPEIKAKYAKQMKNLIVHNKKPTDKNKIDIGVVISYPKHINVVFKYMFMNEISNNKKDSLILSFFKGLDEIIQTSIFSDFRINKVGNSVNNTFIEMTADSIDVYGLGFTLQYVLNEFNKKRLISKPFYTKCTSLFKTMYTFNPLQRNINTQQLRDYYTNIITTTKI